VDYKTAIGNLVGEVQTVADVDAWMIEGLQFCINGVPTELLWGMEFSDAVAATGVAVGTNKIMYVQRTYTEAEQIANGVAAPVAPAVLTDEIIECRKVDAGLSGRVTAGSGWQEESSVTDPVWFTLGGKLHLQPTSSEADSKAYWVRVPPSGKAGTVVQDPSVGTNDMTVTVADSTFSSTDTVFVVTIDAAADPDTFAWTKDGAGGASGVAILEGGNELEDGVTVTFATTTGHTSADAWTFTIEGWNNARTVGSGEYLPQDIDYIIVNAAALKAAEKKLGDIANGDSASLEAYIVAEDLDVAQAQQIMTEVTFAMIKNIKEDINLGMGLLLKGYELVDQSEQAKKVPAYSQVTR
jgi:hypothetical protein